MTTCYDYSFARLLNQRIDLILVGDSLGQVVLGYDRTTLVCMEDMLRHMQAVRRGAPDAFIIADLPAGSYETPAAALTNTARLINAGADAVKPEGRAEIIRALVDNGYAVMGHLGYLPQTAATFSVVGKSAAEAARLQQQALAIEQSGAFSLVLECIPSTLAAEMTRRLKIPTIGIGAGAGCDGQVMVLYDLLGLFNDFKPKFVKRYEQIAERIKDAVDAYANEVRNGIYPGTDEEYN